MYKRYYSEGDGTELFSTSQIDTVRLFDEEIIGDKTYSKLLHKVYDEYGLRQEYFDYLTVDEYGHLINPTGKVIHPGKDKNYTTAISGQYGYTNYKSEDTKDITIENKNYQVYPYVGDFIPTNNIYPAGRSKYVYFQENMGIVLNHSTFDGGLAYYEDQLIYYKSN